MTDSTKHQGQRRQLVKLLEEKGIQNKEVLTAVGTVPRHTINAKLNNFISMFRFIRNNSKFSHRL